NRRRQSQACFASALRLRAAHRRQPRSSKASSSRGHQLLGSGVAVSSEKQAALILPQIGQAVAGTHITPFSSFAVRSMPAGIVLFPLRGGGGGAAQNGKSRPSRGLRGNRRVGSRGPMGGAEPNRTIDCLAFAVVTLVTAASDGTGI